MTEYCVNTPEFFVSRVQHIEDMRNGCVRYWFCIERTTPDGVSEKETVLTVIMPVSAIPEAVALRQAIFGKTRDWPIRMPRSAALTRMQ